MASHITARLPLAVTAVLAMSAQTLLAYNPPTDKVGPLTVTIEGPDTVTEVGRPLPVKLTLENSGDRQLKGSLRLAVIDRWTVDPAGAVPLSIAAGGKETLQFKVTAGDGTYSAHYPIHAYAEFEADGSRQTAHPVLIVETRLPAAAGAGAGLRFEPIAVPANSELALWRIETHRSVVAPGGKAPVTMPVGWQGSEAVSRGSTGLATETLGGVSRPCIVIHPPYWQGNVGSQWIEYPLALPNSTPIRLQLANAMTPDGQSDGVTFRVRVAAIDAAEGAAGEVVFERHTAAKTWTEAAVDLSAFAGRTIRLQLESHPGPANNTGWDRSLWAEPLLVAGTIPEPAPFPPATNEGSRDLGTVTTAGGAYEVRLWPGRRGLLDAVVGFSRGEKRVFFRGFQVTVLGGRIDDSRSPILLEEAREEACEAGTSIRHRFRSRLGAFDLVVRLWVDAGGLKAALRLENAPQLQPWQACYLEEVAIGPWSQTIGQVYGGAGNVVRKPEGFELGFDGHRLATSFVGIDFEGGPSLVQASDLPPLKLRVAPEVNCCALHTAHDCTLTFIPADNVFDAVKHWRATNGLEAAGGVRKAAGSYSIFGAGAMARVPTSCARRFATG